MVGVIFESRPPFAICMGQQCPIEVVLAARHGWHSEVSYLCLNWAIDGWREDRGDDKHKKRRVCV
jgi:hypothetical protein